MVKPQTPNLKDECSSHSVSAMICSKCKQDKDETEFPFKNKETGKRNTVCKVCQREYRLKYYYKNKQSHYERNKRTEAEIKEFYESYKAAHPCIVCGESAPECVDFHHLRDKVDVLAHMVKGGSLKKLKEELEKCVPLCANCHRKVHSGRLDLTPYL